MFGAGWLNLGSLVLGMVAWILPLVSLLQHHKADRSNWIVFSIASISACAVSLCMQMFYTNHLVKIRDWSALMDISNAVALCAALLLTVTIILNTIMLVIITKNGVDKK
ncbi:MAG: hypothetical protein ABFD04_13510 [Syntrophomonas sp.]